MSEQPIIPSNKTLNIVKKAKKYLKTFFKKETPVAYKFHRYSDVKEVIDIVKSMAKHYNLSNEEKEVLLLANWFRFSGITKKYRNYQEESANIAEAFLVQEAYPIAKIKQVKQLIKSTENDQTSEGLLFEITHDAAIAYTGRKRFFRKSNLLRIEIEEVDKHIIKNKAWEDQQYKLLSQTHFKTQFANLTYHKTQAKNIQKQRKQIQKANTAAIRKKTGKEFGRGIDTLYRTAYRNHINLSSIADGKANMMISINTIILSAIVTLLGTSMTLSGQYSFQHIRYFIPILILLIFVLVSAIFAILSARPKVNKNKVTTNDILQRTKSILFFGNFISMEKDEFVESMGLLKRNQELLYDNMAVDMYFLGHVLSRKYRLIKYSYNIFMAGLILCVLAFMFVMIDGQVNRL